jgi:hypothetical protein
MHMCGARRFLAVVSLLAIGGLGGGCGDGMSNDVADALSGDAGASGNSDAKSNDGSPGGSLDGGVDAPRTDFPAQTWSWVPIEGAVCGNGSGTGMGVNVPGTRQRDSLLIYLMGGGACWDALTCFVLRAASHLETGYGLNQFAADHAVVTDTGFLVRGDSAPPSLATTSWVLFPYCTGDLHAGHSVRAYNPLEPARLVHHRGGDNIELYLRRLRQEFPDVKTIWLSGSSAGGFGAALNFDRVQTAFPAAEVHLLVDSAQQITPGQGRWPVMRDAWAMKFAPTCLGCSEGLPAVVGYLARIFPESRLALMAYEQDQTLATFWGYSGAEVQAATNALLAAQYTRPNTKYLLLPGSKHVALAEYKTTVTSTGKPLKTWIEEWATGDPAWASAR